MSGCTRRYEGTVDGAFDRVHGLLSFRSLDRVIETRSDERAEPF